MEGKGAVTSRQVTPDVVLQCSITHTSCGKCHHHHAHIHITIYALCIKAIGPVHDGTISD